MKFNIYITADKHDLSITVGAVKAVENNCQIKSFDSDTALLLELLKHENSNVDAIFLDINMPQARGLKCLNVLKCHKHLKKIPVYILASSSDTELMNEYYEAGAANYFSKPNTFLGFTEIVLQVLKNLSTKTME